jgi:Cu2+-exporting ATPase
LSQALAAGADSSAPPPIAWATVVEHAGRGLEATSAQGRRFRLGSASWAGAQQDPESGGPRVWLGEGEQVLAVFEFDEAVRADAAAALAALAARGLALRMLSGDRAVPVREVADRLGLAQAQADARPADKLAAVAALQRDGHCVGMVGDGLNDAPVMARADVSFAMGEGAALTRSKADFVVASGRLADVATARETARRAMRIVRQNLSWAVAYNAVCVPLALFGAFPPWAAGLGMATSSLLVVLNSIRIDPRAGAEAARIA